MFDLTKGIVYYDDFITAKSNLFDIADEYTQIIDKGGNAFQLQVIDTVTFRGGERFTSASWVQVEVSFTTFKDVNGKEYFIEGVLKS